MQQLKMLLVLKNRYIFCSRLLDSCYSLFYWQTASLSFTHICKSQGRKWPCPIDLILILAAGFWSLKVINFVKMTPTVTCFTASWAASSNLWTIQWVTVRLGLMFFNSCTISSKANNPSTQDLFRDKFTGRILNYRMSQTSKSWNKKV